MCRNEGLFQIIERLGSMSSVVFEDSCPRCASEEMKLIWSDYTGAGYIAEEVDPDTLRFRLGFDEVDFVLKRVG